MNELQRELQRIKSLKKAIKEINPATEPSGDIRGRMIMYLENLKEDLVRSRIKLAHLLRSDMGRYIE